jgi:hypothetical protein
VGEQERAIAAERRDPRCPYCHDAVSAGAVQGCPGCAAWHHAACWTEAGQCGACGQVVEGAGPPVAPARLDPKAVEAGPMPAFADRLRAEWSDGDLRDAIKVHFERYTADQRRAIYEEIEARELARTSELRTHYPLPTRSMDYARSGCAGVIVVWVFVLAMGWRNEGLLILLGATTLVSVVNLLVAIVRRLTPPRP